MLTYLKIVEMRRMKRMKNERFYKLSKAYGLCDQIYYLHGYPEAIEKVVSLLERLKISYEKKEQEYVVLEESIETNNG